MKKPSCSSPRQKNRSASGQNEAGLQALRESLSFEYGGPDPQRRDQVSQTLELSLVSRELDALEAAESGQLQDALSALDQLLALSREAGELLVDPNRWSGRLERQKTQLLLEQDLLEKLHNALKQEDFAKVETLRPQMQHVRHAKALVQKLLPPLESPLEMPSPTPRKSEDTPILDPPLLKPVSPQDLILELEAEEFGAEASGAQPALAPAERTSEPRDAASSEAPVVTAERTSEPVVVKSASADQTQVRTPPTSPPAATPAGDGGADRRAPGRGLLGGSSSDRGADQRTRRGQERLCRSNSGANPAHFTSGRHAGGDGGADRRAPGRGLLGGSSSDRGADQRTRRGQERLCRSNSGANPRPLHLRPPRRR